MVGDSGPSTPAPTLTPVPVDEATASPARAGGATATRTPGEVPFPYPAGYGPGGVTNASAAATSHERALADLAGYVQVSRSATRVDGETHRGVVRQAVGGGVSTLERRADGTLELAIWATDDVRYVYNNDTGVDRYEIDSTYLTVTGPVHHEFTRGAEYVDRRAGVDPADLVRVGEFGAPRPVERDGETLLSYRATRPTEDLRETDDFADFEMRLAVDRTGLVRLAEGSVVRRVGEDTRYATRLRATLTPVENGSTPERPDWLSRTAQATLSEESGYLVLTNTGERAVGLSRVEVRVNDSGYSTPTNGTLAPGERLYVSRHPTGSAFAVEREPPAEDEYRPIANDSRVTVATGNESVGVVVGAQT